MAPAHRRVPESDSGTRTPRRSSCCGPCAAPAPHPGGHRIHSNLGRQPCRQGVGGEGGCGGGGRALRPSTERRPEMMHSFRPVPSTTASYASSMAAGGGGGGGRGATAAPYRRGAGPGAPLGGGPRGRSRGEATSPRRTSPENCLPRARGWRARRGWPAAGGNERVF